MPTKPIQSVFLYLVISLLIFGLVYFVLESFFYSNFGCGCSSSCIGFYPTNTTKYMGYATLALAISMIVLSLWRFKNFSKLWALPALLLVGLACYGNGYMLYDRGVCENSLYQKKFFIIKTKLGDYAKTDGESIDLDLLQKGQLDGKLLGYNLTEKQLTLFRINAEPLKINTQILFWRIDQEKLENYLPILLSTYRNTTVESKTNFYEMIGGQGMKEEDFIKDIDFLYQIYPHEISQEKLSQLPDGSTRFRFSKSH